MASIPTNTARTAPLDTTVKLGAAQQRALKDLVAMGFGKQACKEALLRTGTTSMDRLLAALTGPVEEPPVRKRDAAGTPKAVPRPRPRPTPQKRPVPTAAPKVGAHLKHGDVRGVAAKVYTKGNAHTWIDLKTTSGDVIEVRSTQVESIELTEDEVLACSKEMAPDDWLRLRVDGLVKLPSRQGVVGNRFTASDGSEKRQLVVEGSIIKCALCDDATWDLGGDVHRNWHAAQHSIKSHCGHFASCRRGNAHVEALEKASGKEISMEGAPVKTARPAKRARVVSQTRRMIGPKNRPASARPDSHLKLNTALHQLHPDFDGTRKFPRGRGIMPSFLLENIDRNDVTNENHEAFEQFVVCWLFNEIIPRTCRVPGKVDAKGVRVEVDETKPSIRVLELGGGIGAVSTMIQQNLQMVDSQAPHVVVEPNALLSDGPLLRNRLRHGSRFDVIRGVVSSKEKVAFGLGDINPNHPRAWMWGTIDASASRKVDVRGAPLSEVEDLLGGAPTVLVADCEGGLISLLEDYPQVVDEVVAIYYERDPPGDYTASEALLAAKGFVPVLIASLHRVVVRESALPRPVKPADATMADAAPAAEAATPAAKAKAEPPSPSPSPTLSSSTDDADARRAAVVARYAAELSSLVEEKEQSAKQLEGLVQETRAHAQKYGAVNKELEAALLEFIEDHAEPALRAAIRAKDAVAEASQMTTVTRRKLAENSRVLCGWHDDAWSDDEALEWYPGCATPSDPTDAACDVYDVVFDDGDGRERVKREELRSVFVPGAFDWASPFVEDDEEVEEEAVDLEDFPLLSSDDGTIMEALRLPPPPPKKGARVRGRYKHEGTEKWFHGSVVGITCKRGRSMLLLVRYDGEDEAVDEAWPSEDLEVLAPEEDAAMAVEPPAEPDALPPKKRGRKEPKPAVEPAAVEPATEPPKLSLAEMATAAARAARQEEAAAPPEDSDSSDDEPIGMVAGPRV